MVSIKQVNITQVKNNAGRNVLLVITDHNNMVKITDSNDSYASECTLFKRY